MDAPPFLSGQLLLAMPGMGDPRFERAVIAICVHDQHGAVGIGIGHQRAGTRLRSLMAQLGVGPGLAPDARYSTAVRSSPAGALSSIAPIGAGRTPSPSLGSAP